MKQLHCAAPYNSRQRAETYKIFRMNRTELITCSSEGNRGQSYRGLAFGSKHVFFLFFFLNKPTCPLMFTLHRTLLCEICPIRILLYCSKTMECSPYRYCSTVEPQKQGKIWSKETKLLLLPCHNVFMVCSTVDCVNIVIICHVYCYYYHCYVCLYDVCWRSRVNIFFFTFNVPYI